MTEQSNFNNDQDYLSPPPEVLAKEAAKLTNQANQKKRWWLVVAVLAGLLIGLLLLLAWTMSRRPAEVAPQPTPTPRRETPATNTEIELRRLQGLVDVADPSTDAFPPPQVDMKVEF